MEIRLVEIEVGYMSAYEASQLAQAGWVILYAYGILGADGVIHHFMIFRSPG
jgi:hypothetical protein